MKKGSLVSLLLFLTAVSVACAQDKGAAKEPAKPESLHDKASYAIGLNLGNNLRQNEVEVSVDQLVQGLKDGLAGADAKLSQEEIQATMKELQKEVMAKQETKNKALGEKNKKEGDEFLAANKDKEGVVTLPSGLQYKVLNEGSGANPTTEDKVTVNYRGTLIDGTEFDSSYKRGQPATFPVKGVIPGFSEALQKMKVGSKWMVYIPADLAYGERGGGPVIGPNATLVFELELLGIEGKDGAKPSSDAGGKSDGSHR